MENDLLQKIWKINRADIDLLRRMRSGSQVRTYTSHKSVKEHRIL